MPIEGLTQQQSDFIERFLKVPKVFKRKAAKKRREEAAEQFRLFNAEHDLIREEIMALEDPALRSIFLAQLAAAEKVIEQNPDKLDFEGGHKQLEDVQAALILHVRKEDAKEAHAQLEKAVARMDKENPLVAKAGDADGQSDIDLTWAYIQEKFQKGMAANDAKALDEALRAMGRLEGMMRTAEAAGKNPFEARLAEVGDAKAAALEGLDPKVQDARRRLSDTFNQLQALRDKLTAQFGEGNVPLALRMAVSDTQTKLDAAVDAAPAALPDLADDAEEKYAQAARDATKLIAEAQRWQQDHEAFRVRYAVMMAHPKKDDSEFVKPEFDKITAAYRAARDKAKAHDYLGACQDIAVVRNDLKDALDFADDCANYDLVLKEREALLATLPARDKYPLDSLRDKDTDARKLRTDAIAARAAKQMSGALTLLNQIPAAVEEILDLNKFATNYAKYRKALVDAQAKLANNSEFPAEVRAFIQDEIDQGARAVDAAKADADRGAYRSAAGQLLSLYGFYRRLFEKGAYVQGYLVEREAFTDRRRETRGRRGPEGRIAIESYYQALVDDEAKRKAAEAAGDIKLAQAMCLRRKSDHAEMMKLADDAKLYLARKVAFDAEYAKLAGRKSADALEAKATADTMLANAVAATARGNWLAGENLLQNALLEIKRAVDDAETEELIDGLQSGEGGMVLTPTTEFKDAYAAFVRVKEHVDGQDTHSMFADALTAADEQARSAEALMPAQLQKAQDTLNAATAACKDISFKLTAANTYGDQRAATISLTDLVKGANKKGLIDAEVEAAKKALKDAKAAVKPPALDFPAAIRLLAEGQAKARLGLDVRATYEKTVRPVHAATDPTLKKCRKSDYAPYLGASADRLQAARDAMDKTLADRDLPGTVAAAAKTMDINDALIPDFDLFKEAEDFIARWVRGKQGIEMTDPMTTQEAAVITDLLAKMNDAHTSGRFGASLNLAKMAYFEMHKARKKAQSSNEWLPRERLCGQWLDALKPRAVPAAGPGYDKVEALKKTFADAQAKAALENFSGAAKMLEGFGAACTEAEGDLYQYDLFVLQQTRAQAALDGLRQRRTPALEPLLVRLEGKDANAQRKANGFDFIIAAELYAELHDECNAAEATAERIEDFAAVTSEIKVIGDDDLDELTAAIQKAEGTLTALGKEPSAMYVHEEVGQGHALLDAARKKAADDFAGARADVGAAVDLCVQMTLMMAQYDELNNAAAVARELAKKLLKDHPLRKTDGHAEVAVEEINTRMAALEVAMTAARSSKSNRAQTQTEIEETITALRDLRRMLDDHFDYAQKRAPVEKTLEELEKGEHRHLLREDLAKARRSLDTAATRAADRNHKSAVSEVEAAGVRLEMAKLRAKLATNDRPTKEEVQKILDAPDGIGELDKIIDKLEPSVQRDVMKVAFEARFGCELQMTKPGTAAPKIGPDGKPLPVPEEAEDQMDLPAPNIRRFYKEMSKLPPSDTLDNDSMLTFTHKSGVQEGSSYNWLDKKVVMREGDEATSRIYGIGAEHEIGTIDPAAVPKPGKEHTAFSWNTLHEVGHAVDDKLGYMKKHGERLAGWKVYGANVGEAAREIAGHFDFDPDYVAEYMLSSAGRVLAMPDPGGVDPEEWQRRMQECRTFVDRAREGNKPWSSASVAAACAVGDYTYVESYPGDWARYRTDQRKYAVSGYQFRAPGEWFSELYAALHSQRLNDNHPHKEEFEKL